MLAHIQCRIPHTLYLYFLTFCPQHPHTHHYAKPICQHWLEFDDPDTLHRKRLLEIEILRCPERICGTWIESWRRLPLDLQSSESSFCSWPIVQFGQLKESAFYPPPPVFPQFLLQCNTVQDSRKSKMSDQLVELIWCKKWWGRTIVWDTHRQLLPPTPPQSAPPPASDGWPDCLLINWIVSLINGHDKGETGGYATTLLYLHKRIPSATCIFQALNHDFCKHGVCTEI